MESESLHNPALRLYLTDTGKCKCDRNVNNKMKSNTLQKGRKTKISDKFKISVNKRCLDFF